MPTLLQRKVLSLAFTATANLIPSAIPEPALHVSSLPSAERRKILPAPFYEESTFWNPSWDHHPRRHPKPPHHLRHGGHRGGIGSGRLLSADSYKKMVSTELRGKTAPSRAAPPASSRTAATAMVSRPTGHWLLQNPMFAGYAAVETYLPSQRVAVAKGRITYAPEASMTRAIYRNQADTIFSRSVPR